MESELASFLQQADSSGPSLILFPPFELPGPPPSTSMGFTPQGIRPSPRAPTPLSTLLKPIRAPSSSPLHHGSGNCIPLPKGVVPWARTVSFTDTLVSPL